MTLEPEDIQGLKHYGVKGQKWGTRHAYRKAIAMGSWKDLRSHKLDRSANRLNKRVNKLENKTNGVSSKKNDKLMTKANRIAEKSSKRKIKADNYHSAAQAYIQAAADTGVRSFSTPKRDAAKVAINAFIGYSLNGLPLAVGNGINAYTIIKRQNATAAKANKLQDERKDK